MNNNTKKALETIAPILEGFTPKTSSSENNMKLPAPSLSSVPEDKTDDTADHPLSPIVSSLMNRPESGINSTASSRAPSRKSSNASKHKPQLPKIGKIGVCAMDAKVLSKPCRQILNRLIERGEFETIIFGDKVILDESVENWPTCDFLISFFSNGFPLDKAIDYVKLRKPFVINDLDMQKVLWDRRLCLQLLNKAGVPTPRRLEISRDGGPQVDEDLRAKLHTKGLDLEHVDEPKWKMIDEDTLEVDGEVLTKPFVEKPVDGEDHNIYIYYHSKNGGGGRRLFRKVGNKSSEFDPSLSTPRTDGSFIYEQFMDTDNFEDVKAYTVGETYCHAETRKSPVVDGIVKRNTHGKEIRYVTELSPEEKIMAQKTCNIFGQTICGFDLLRVGGKSYVIDVNGLSFVKDNTSYYDSAAKILRDAFIKAKSEQTDIVVEEKTQKWMFKGLVTVVRHADRTPKQKIKHSFKSPIFISLLKGHKEEVVIREVDDLRIVLKAIEVAIEENAEDLSKLHILADTLSKKVEFPGTKIQLKPVLVDNEITKVNFILKWGGEISHAAGFQATELGEQLRQDLELLNRDTLNNVTIYSSSERRVLASAQLWASALLGEEHVEDIHIRKDLLDDSNAAKDLMDSVKKKLKPLLREGKEAPPQFVWPAQMPEPYSVIKRVVELMNYHKKILDHNFETKDIQAMQRRWCCAEDPFLFKERWDKLFKEFVTVEKVDPSKISELYDTMKFDALHNRSFLEQIFTPDDVDEDISKNSLVSQYPVNLLAQNNFKISDAQKTVGSLGWVLDSSPENDSNSPFHDKKFIKLRELYSLSKVLFDFICPQEYGIEDTEKMNIGLLTSLPLAKHLLNKIQEMKDKDTASCVAYFTKESHMYTLLNVIYGCNLPMRIARNALPELDYLSQIIFELYESTDSVTGIKTHSLRLKLSPGCHTQDPLDVQLDSKHYISCIPKISLTKHLDLDLVAQKWRSRFAKVTMPKKFTPVNITSPGFAFTEHHVDEKDIPEGDKLH